MSSRFDKMIKDFVNTITEHKESVGPYDTTAEVVRIEGNIAFVHIPGGIAETPVSKNIDCKIGDIVQIRVGGGRAWITGNTTAPPTDDTTAVKASGTATKFITDLTNGIFVHPENDKGNGVKVTDGVYIIKDGKIAGSFVSDGVILYDKEGEIAYFHRGVSPETGLGYTPRLNLKKKYGNTNIVYESNLDGHELNFNDVGESLNGVSSVRYTRWGTYYNGSGIASGQIVEGELYQQVEPIYIQSGEILTTHVLELDPGNWLINFGGAFASNANGERRFVVNNNINSAAATRYDINVRAASNNPTIINGVRILEVSNPNTTFYLHVYQNSGDTIGVNPYIKATKLL